VTPVHLCLRSYNANNEQTGTPSFFRGLYEPASDICVNANAFMTFVFALNVCTASKSDILLLLTFSGVPASPLLTFLLKRTRSCLHSYDAKK
jgi:hypothetical protein